MASPKKKKPRKYLGPFVILLLLLAFGLYKAFGPVTSITKDPRYIYVHTGSDYEKLKLAMEEAGFKPDIFFDLLARAANLPEHVHPGKYRLAGLMSNYQVVRMLRAGRQTQVKLVINKVRTKNELVTLVCSNLEADSTAFRALLGDPVLLAKYGLDTNTVLCAFIPNTYFFKWNTPADKTFKKLEDTYAHFWNESRKAQAQAHGLTPVKATIVASIVDEETNMADDKPKIASVYLNRLQKGMKLGADPTVKYAIGDFTIKRITGAMLQYESPYNTYVYAGLPPGPICTPAISSIDAVLEAPKTTYLFFCAKEDFSGHSNFASTYDEHLKNAHAYQKALDARGIH